MAQPVSMQATARAINDAQRTVLASGHHFVPEAHGAILAVVLREYLDNEYTDDLGDQEHA